MTAPRKKRSQRASLVRRWRVALANAGITQAEWARRNGPEERGGWTDSHVSQVLSGKRESDVVLAKALAFIDEQERNISRRSLAASA